MQSGNWAFACDFYGNDFKNVRISGEQCGGTCSSTPECTHFTWSYGTCYLKRGQVSKSDAKYTGDQSMVCGIVGGSQPPVTGGPITTARPPVTGTPGKFPGCEFKFGSDWRGPDADYSGFDYITFWIGANSENCLGKPECTDFNQYWEGLMLEKVKQLKTAAVFYGYIIAFEARNKDFIYDCNDPQHPTSTLCQKGANFIRNNRQLILSRYEMHSKKISEYLGTQSTTIFLIEPDFLQYHDNWKQEGGPLTGAQMRSLFDDIVKAIKKNLPNALISWDISPWISEYEMRQWWGYFSSAQIDFINTSGGGNHANSETIQMGHGLTWSFMSQLTGKKIISDCGYGVVGSPDDNRGPWYDPYNLNNRARDGVVANSFAYVTQKPTYRPNLC